MESLVVFIFIAFVILMGGMAVWGYLWEKKRREGFLLLAPRLGLQFDPARDAHLPLRFGFLDKLAKGENRYAHNILKGTIGDHELYVFDYHYETHTHDSEGHRKTHHHRFSCFVMILPREFPELRISREGLLSKIAQTFGYDDIDFESHEFSRKFCVRSKDKKFAYDFCHARMIEYLLANPDLNIELDVDALALLFDKRLAVEAIESNLARLQRIRGLMPDYIFQRS